MSPEDILGLQGALGIELKIGWTEELDAKIEAKVQLGI